MILELLHGQILSLRGGDAYGAVLARRRGPSGRRCSSRSHCPPVVGLNEFAAQRVGLRAAIKTAIRLNRI